MTENYPPASGPPLPGEPLPVATEWDQDPAAASPTELPSAAGQDKGTADIAKDQAADLGQSAVQAGKHAADTAREQAAGVVAEAGRQGQDLLRQAQDQVGQQVSEGHQQLTSRLSSFSAELSSMADNSAEDGPATSLARQAASWAHDAGQWLDDRTPGQVLDEVQSFARRRPAAFVALAAGAGLIAGRLTRGMKAASDSGTAASDDGPDVSGQFVPDAEDVYQPGRGAPLSDDVAAAPGPLATPGAASFDSAAAYDQSAVFADDRGEGRNLS